MGLTAEQVLPGGVKIARKRVTASYLVTLNDYLIEINNGTTAASLTLPDAVTCPNQAFLLKRYSGTDTGNVFITSAGGQVQSAAGTFAASQGLSSSSSFRNALYVSDGQDWLFCGV